MKHLLGFMQRKLRNSTLHKTALLNAFYIRSIRHYVRFKARKNINFRGLRIRIHHQDASISPGLISGTYENHQLNIFECLVRSSRTVLDVGANIGIYSLAAFNEIEGGLIVAVEPDQTNLELLKFNIQNNEAYTIVVVEAAVSDADGEADFIGIQRSSGTHRLSRGEITKQQSGENKSSLVRTRSLTSIANELMQEIDILKIDVEGFEPLCITDDFLREYLPKFLFIEYEPVLIESAGFDAPAFLQRLFSVFEACFLINERSASLGPVDSLERIFDSNETNLLFVRDKQSLGLLKSYGLI